LREEASSDLSRALLVCRAHRLLLRSCIILD
jgi:hypothetical protein